MMVNWKNIPKEYRNQIVTGDARELSKRIPDESVDLIVTSPPYNLGNNHHTGNRKYHQYDDDMPEGEYQEQQTNLLEDLFRLVKPAGSLFYNHKNRIKDGISISPYVWILKTNWTVKQEIVWRNGSQNFDKCRWYPQTERIYWLAKTNDTKMINVVGNSDFVEWKAAGASGKKFKRAFPESMPKEIIACFPDAEIILDPYCGSGTVPSVCKQLGRNYIAFEIDPDTADLARKRVQETNPPLFTLEPQPEQKELF